MVLQVTKLKKIISCVICNPDKPRKNKKFWKDLICLLFLHYLKISFALKPAFTPT
jgi:hypothetical protein